MQTTTRTKILLALSGGVDSAVCAHLLKEQGYDVRAVVMKMSELHEKTVAAAKEAAESLRIPLTVLDLRDVFRENVISYFIRSYQSGITPNPCVVCNPTVKFKYLIEEADRQGCAFAATGHYAKLRCREDGRVELLRGDSDQRDQSYMLYRLTQKELSRLIFPLAHMERMKCGALPLRSDCPALLRRIVRRTALSQVPTMRAISRVCAAKCRRATLLLLTAQFAESTRGFCTIPSDSVNI